MPDAASDLARLLSLIAHELRTPLSVTSGYVKMLASERPGPLNDGQRQAVAGAARACDMLTMLGADLALLGRLERGEVTPTAVAVDLAAVVAGIVGESTSHPDHPVTVRVASTDPVTLRVDTAHLSRVLRALLATVVRAAPDHATVDIAWRTRVRSPDSGPENGDTAPGTKAPGHAAPGHTAPGNTAPGNTAPNDPAPNHGAGRSARGAARGAAGRAVAFDLAPRETAPGSAAPAETAPGDAASVHIAFAEAHRVEALLDADPAALVPLDEAQAGLGMALPIAARLVALADGTIGAVRDTQPLGLRLTLPLRA